MKKTLTLLLTVMAFVVARSQQVQTQIIFTTDFDNNPGGFLFDSVGPTGNNFGTNDWVVNNVYQGNAFYPNTPSEDSTQGGLIINNAPFSNYLHITDKTSADANDNWNPIVASDRFVYIGQEFCTLGYSSIQFTFDWISVGDPTAYGQLYFRADNGPWTQIGLPKYNNQPKWVYESVIDNRLLNKQNVQLGFRWVNPGSGGAYSTAFGIDDIFAIGTFNENATTGPATFSVQALDNLICQGTAVDFSLQLTNSFCDAQYELQLSNKYGQFDDPFDIGDFELGPGMYSGDYQSALTDVDLLGNCFKIRLVRESPLPMQISDTSVCFSIGVCNGQIYNVSVPVFNDADTTCLQSEVDVLFFSDSVFQNGNIYYAELSDTNGNFADSTILGQLPSRDSFPGPGPGDITGVVPQSLPPGCGYYLRVYSTNPYRVSQPIGPFCFKQCDVLTNNITDLSFCAGPNPYPFANCQVINIANHQWNKSAVYDTCNNWVVELRKMSDFSLVSFGDLGVFHADTGGNFTLCIKSLPQTVAPGEYYMRISSTCSSTGVAAPFDSTGTVIRITIGEPQPVAPSVFIEPNVVCPGTEAFIFVNPFNSPPSNYIGYGSLFFGDTVGWPGPDVVIAFPPNVYPPGIYNVGVEEINYGCYGPGSALADITLLPGPIPHITGPTVVCIGDSAQYNVNFIDTTYYVWYATTGATVQDPANVQTWIGFNHEGTYTVTNFSANLCGAGADSLIVTVGPPYYHLNAGPDTTVCFGDSVSINANPTPLVKSFQVQDSGAVVIQGGMFNLVAHSNLTIDSFGLFLNLSASNMQGEVYGKQGTYLGYEQNPSAWQLLASNYTNPTQSVGQFSTIQAEVGHKMAPGDSFAFYVTTTGTPAIDVFYGPGNGLQGTFYNTDGNVDFIQGTVLDYKFRNNLTDKAYILNVLVYYSTTKGLSYNWSNGDTTPAFSILPRIDTSYSIKVTDHGQCVVHDSVKIKVAPIPQVTAGPDTDVCPNQPYIMQGSSTSPSASFIWNPGTGLSSATDPNATFNYNDSVAYVLKVTDSAGRCSNKSAVLIAVPLNLTLGPDTTICEGDLVTIHAISTGEVFTWSPGSQLNDSTILNPVFNSAGSSGGNFTITAIDKNGCKLTGTVVIGVENCNGKIVAPTAFTPSFAGNGTGAADDHFIVWGKNIKEYQVKIYNRWGELVYDSGELGGLQENYSPPLWDGKYKGKIQDTGTFVYYITATTDDGKSLKQKGNITLIR